MQDKVSRAQSFPAYHSSARASVRLDCTGSSVLLPALATDTLLGLLREPHTQTVELQLSAPKQHAPNHSADSSAFHMCFIPRELFLICV